MEIEEDYGLNKIPQMIRADPNSVRFTMLETLRDRVGFYGSLRIKFLKKAFKLIIDNIIPEFMKTTMMSVLHLSHSEWIKKMSSNANASRKNYKEGPKSNKYYFMDDCENIEPIIALCNATGKEFKRKSVFLRRQVLKVVKARNSILTILKELHDSYDEHNVYLYFEKDHYLKIMEASKKLSESSAFNCFDMWSIKRKEANSELPKD
jgi:hypothetical protein